jgi:hypothetical protein
LGIRGHNQGEADEGEDRCCQYATELRKAHELTYTTPLRPI